MPRKAINRRVHNHLGQDMGVSATGESGEIFPTRTLTPQKYWGNSPVKTGPDGEYFTGESGQIISENI